MDMKSALKEQFHAGLAMLAECVEKCPDDMWLTGAHPRHYWRIALHAAFFTQVGIVQNEAAYEPWPERPDGLHERMWQEPAFLEPYELPEDAEPLTKQQVLAYVAFVDDLVDQSIATLDLDIDESGYRWYPGMSKLSNVLMNLRHIQGHVGQLSEILLAQGIETTWIGKGRVGEWKRWEEENP